jgi:DNA-binding beta-propeller fold protein YncE
VAGKEDAKSAPKIRPIGQRPGTGELKMNSRLKQELLKTSSAVTKRQSALVAALFLAFAIMPAPAVGNELVGSSESHSIEKFDGSGKWLNTFASTGPWIPFSLAVSPKTNDVFVATEMATSAPVKENPILRYTWNGDPYGPGGDYWHTFDLYSHFGVNPVESILFDANGDLYVASHYGTAGYKVVILRFSESELKKKSPTPSGVPIVTTVGRGDQMAWDRLGNLCIASFIAPATVQCYDPNTAALAYDYATEFAGFTPTIQPVGLAFGPNNNLYVSSTFSGQIDFERVEHSGPMVTLASGLVPEIMYIATDPAGFLYVPSYHDPGARYDAAPPNSCTFYACMDYDTRSDVVYKIDPGSGSVTPFITTHIWGPYDLIFVPF